MLVNPQILIKGNNKKFFDGGFQNNFYLNGHFDLNIHNYDKHRPIARLFESALENKEPFEEIVWDYGVCDSPQQFLEKFQEYLDNLDLKLVVMFSPIPKDPSNRGQGGGWRWHKWGEYYGTGIPTCEYLDDEDGFGDGVWVFHIYDVGHIELA